MIDTVLCKAKEKSLEGIQYLIEKTKYFMQAPIYKILTTVIKKTHLRTKKERLRVALNSKGTRKVIAQLIRPYNFYTAIKAC